MFDLCFVKFSNVSLQNKNNIMGRNFRPPATVVFILQNGKEFGGTILYEKKVKRCFTHRYPTLKNAIPATSCFKSFDPMDPITLSDDEQGVYNHHPKRKVFWFHETILRFCDWIPNLKKKSPR